MVLVVLNLLIVYPPSMLLVRISLSGVRELNPEASRRINPLAYAGLSGIHALCHAPHVQIMSKRCVAVPQPLLYRPTEIRFYWPLAASIAPYLSCNASSAVMPYGNATSHISAWYSTVLCASISVNVAYREAPHRNRYSVINIGPNRVPTPCRSYGW